MTTADALRTFSAVQAELAAAACILLDFEADQGDDMSTKTVTIKVRNPRASAHYPAEERAKNGAVDCDVMIIIDDANGTHEYPCSDGEVTVYRDEANGGYGTAGTPRDVWASSKLLKVLDSHFSERDVEDLLGKIAGLASLQATDPNANGASGVYEIE